MIDEDEAYSWTETNMNVVVRNIEKQDLLDIESILSYISKLYPEYTSITIYEDINDDSGIKNLFVITERELTKYIVNYSDISYLIESDVDEIYLFDNYPSDYYEVNNTKIECEDFFITNVREFLTFSGDEFKKAEYDIVQGKDGSKYSGELSYDNEEYTYKFNLKNEDCENQLSISAYASYYGDVIEILDVNMDGYADVKYTEQEGTLNSIYGIYVWNDTIKNFIKVKCDDELTYFEVFDGYLECWAKNDWQSGVVKKFVWDKNTLVKVSEEDYKTDDYNEDMGNDNTGSEQSEDWAFTPDDIKIDGNTVLGTTYEQLVKTFGKPVEITTYKINPPATEPDYFNYFYVCVYDEFECEFSTGENERDPEPTDTVLRFDITKLNANLDCELYIGMHTDELDLRYSINKIYYLNGDESYDLNNIKNVLESYKPDGCYSEYDKAAIVYHDPESFEEPLAKALVLLFDEDIVGEEDRVQRIVFGYPTAN